MVSLFEHSVEYCWSLDHASFDKFDWDFYSKATNSQRLKYLDSAHIHLQGLRLLLPLEKKYEKYEITGMILWNLTEIT